jgi:carbon-monoxide dehydrogenase large subunit
MKRFIFTQRNGIHIIDLQQTLGMINNVYQEMVDLVAQELGLDPVEVRRINFISSDDFPYLTPTGLIYDTGDYDTVFDRTLEMADYSGWREKARESKNGNGPLIGVGVATVIKMSGGSGESRNEEAWSRLSRTAGSRR